MRNSLISIFVLFILMFFESTHFYKQVFGNYGIKIFLIFFVLFSLRSNVYLALFMGFILGLTSGFYSEIEIMGLHSLFYCTSGYFLAILSNKSKNFRNYWSQNFILLLVGTLYHFFLRFFSDFPLIDKALFGYILFSFLFNLILVKVIFLWNRKH